MDSKPHERIKIALVEDEKRLAHSLERLLNRAGYDVTILGDGQSAIDAVFKKELHLMILDINLPVKSGIEVLRYLRTSSYNTPILVLTGRDSTKDKIEGLDLGADDYLTKPFDSAELIARIQAILRRSGALRTSILHSSDLTLDVVKRVVKRANKTISLTQTEFTLLEFFLRNKNTILTRRRIAEQVWGYKFETGTNIVDVYISYLRDSINEGFSPKLIENVRGEGFILRD